MCGILGWLESSGNVDELSLRKMRLTLQHRGPDSWGEWLSEDGRIGLAHQRLAIIDLSESGHQPMVLDDRWVIVFNGEIYNYQEIRTSLEKRGHIFRGNSDTEVLLASYAMRGTDCLSSLHGMFAFVVWDMQQRKLFAARDRIGEKPFYYFFDGHRFMFASELKALAASPGFTKKLNHEALADYLAYGYIPSPKAVWKDCYKLEPGSFLEVASSPANALRLTIRRYWDIDYSPRLEHKSEYWEEGIRSHLLSAARHMTVSDVPLGAFLSGGVDSCAAVAAVVQGNYGRVKTFTMGFEEKEYCETKYSRLMSSRYDLEYIEKVLTPDNVRSVYDSMLWHFDEPFNDYSFFPTYYICKAARERITVALSGDGGDEIFCGYSTFPRLSFVKRLNRIVPVPLRRWPLRMLSYLLPDHSYYKRHMMRLSHNRSEMFRDIMMFIFTKQEMKEALVGEAGSELKEYDPGSVVDKHLGTIRDRNYDVINTMRYLSTKLTLAENMLVKVDRASMACSLEVRPVLLFVPLVEFVSHIPPHFLTTATQTKSILKKALQPWVPMENLYRRKMGFEVPLKKWFAGDLRDLVEETKKSPWINRSFFCRLLDWQKKGQRDFTLQIHNLLFLNSWLNKWMN